MLPLDPFAVPLKKIRQVHRLESLALRKLVNDRKLTSDAPRVASPAALANEVHVSIQPNFS